MERLGAVFVRQRGSHRVYRLPDGTIFVVPYSGPGHETSRFVAEKALRRCGVAQR